MSVLAQPFFPPANSGKPPGAEIGAENRATSIVPGWATFIDATDYVAELTWPWSVSTYQQMRSDSQIEALHIGTVQPVREFRWSIDPNSAPVGLVEQAAMDFGLPILGHEDEDVPRSTRMFDFDSFLDDALLSLIYGHFHFEIVGDSQPNAWRMVKLAPRHPRTIMQIQADAVGDLLGIRQNLPGTEGPFSIPPVIPGGKLLPFIWRKEAGSQVGRSMLRSIYREWLVKDRVIRIAAMNLEKGGGVPVVYGPQGASDAQLRDLGNLASQFKVAEGGGAALPFGSELKFASVAGTPDAISLLEYCDQSMARVWSLMLVQLGLGNSSSGNRALGGEFAIYAARAQRAMAKWVCRHVNRFLDQYTEWNLGDSASHAPLLHYEQAKPDGLSLADMVALIESGALTVDPELEEWIRSEGGLPPKPEPPNTPELGDLSPDEVALVQNSRNPPALPAPGAQKPTLPSSVTEPSVQDPTFAAADPVFSVALPARQLRRQPNDHEIQARIDLSKLDREHQNAVAQAQRDWAGQVVPGQIRALGQQITGHAGVAFTQQHASDLAAPVDGEDVIAPVLVAAARQAAQGAAAEMAAQGITAGIPSDSEIERRVQPIAAAVARMAANGLSLSAQRKAAQIAGGPVTPAQARVQVEEYLNGLKNAWVMDQIQGAVTTAQNAGRGGVFASAGQNVPLTYYSSEILDVSTCDACATVDGTQYASLADAEQDYPSGGYVDCAGGPRCRGTLVAVSASEAP